MKAPIPAQGNVRPRFIAYEVPSDYMAPTLQPGDLVEIDTTVTRARDNGVYLIGFPAGEPMLRRVQVLLDGLARVYCDRDMGTPQVDVCDEQELTVIGRAVRVLRSQPL